MACLPALTGAWRQRAGGVLLSSSGLSSAARTVAPRFAGWPQPAQHQHGDHWRRPAARLIPAFGPQIEPWWSTTATLYVAPDSPKVVQGFAREDLFTVVLEHFKPTPPITPTTYCPPPRSSSTGTCTWPTATPTCCSTAPAIALQGQARSNAQIFRDLAARMGFTEPRFADTDEALCRQAWARRWTSRCCSTKALPRFPSPTRRLPMAAFPRPRASANFQPAPGRPGARSAARPCAESRGGGSIDAVPAGHDLPPARNF